MRRISSVVLAVLVVVVVACRDSVTTPPARAVAGGSTIASCTAPDLSSLLALAAAAFGDGSPNYNSVRGKIENMAHQFANSNPSTGKERAHDIADFVLTKHAESPLPGGDAAVVALVNGVYCFAGIAITVTDPNNSRLIFPNDEPQILYNDDSTAGIAFPADPVFEPSLVTIARSDTSQLGLLTKLDRYPGFIRITQQNDTDTKLKYTVTVAVCAEDVPDEVFPDLRLGHGLGDTSFVITPRPEDTPGAPAAPTLACDLIPSVGLLDRMMDAFAAMLAPQSAHADAALLLRGGGISGTVSEFSPFEPVDTKLSARGGGISGTVSEFLRDVPSASLQMANETESLLGTSSCATIPVGATLPAECVPAVVVETRTFQTKLADVPVEWFVPDTSRGVIAIADGTPEDFSCGTFARSQSDHTNAAGTSAVCWLVDSVGNYRLVAKPGIGGDAPAGVTFENSDGSDSVTFSLTVQPVTISIASPNPQTADPGSVLSPRVRVMLDELTPAANVSVLWTALANSDASVNPDVTLTDGDGYAWTNWTIGAGYNELRARVANAAEDVAVTFTATGNSQTAVLNSCPVGGARDPINDPSKPFAFWVPGPPNGKTMREVDLYFGASGKANRPSDYQIALITRRGNGFLSLFPDTTVVNVELRGNASENKLATFRLRTPIIGSGGNASSTSNAVAMQLLVLNNPDNATVNFNVGPCPLGNCKLPKGCAATEVNLSSVTGNKPLGDTYRRSVGITIRGN